MRIERVIIHKIDKEQGENPKLELSEELIELSNSNNVVFLLEKLNGAFRKESKVLKTEFIEDSKSFQKTAIGYLKQKNDDNFHAFSRDSLTRLVDLLVRVSLATGGYFVFVNYEDNENNYLGVFMVRDHKEVIFNRDESTNTFLVNTTKTVNTDKLAMAARINIFKFNRGDNRYLEVINKQAHQSSYFIDWVEAVLAERSAENTENLVKLISRLRPEEMPVNSETGERYTTDEFKNNLYDNIVSTGRMVRLNEISKIYWGEDEEDFLALKMEEHGFAIDHEFLATPNKLKQLKRYEIKSGKIKLTFTQRDIDLKNIIAGDEDDQIIIESQKLRDEFNKLNA